MTVKIRITIGSIEVPAELNTSKTADAIWNALPIKSKVNLWGEEIYFTIPLHLTLEEGMETVNIGDLGYWPDGPAFCVFFGPTPVSRGREIRPASEVSVFGRVTGNIEVLKKVTGGEQIIVNRIAHSSNST